MSLLTVNVGSSSVRLVAYADPGAGQGGRLADEHLLIAPGTTLDPLAALQAFEERPGIGPIAAVAHRVVHGGARLTGSCRIDAAVEAEIDRLGELAPLHNPPALAWIRAARARLPAAAQVAVFDTAFFHALPPHAQDYALPAAWARSDPLRRYGFHGLAHRSLWQRWAALRPAGAGGRVISLQLGSGCSIAAIRDGLPLDTSMGFSPLEGLVMASRCGDLDPGLLLYLQHQHGWSALALEQRLNRECGLLGLSGLSGDVNVLLRSVDPAAQRALELYCYRIRKYLGAYLAVLGGADAVLFGGGVGEHLPVLRERILAGLEWAGIALDPARNAAADGSHPERPVHAGRIDVRVIAVDEAQILAREALEVLQRAAPGAPVAPPV